MTKDKIGGYCPLMKEDCIQSQCEWCGTVDGDFIGCTIPIIAVELIRFNERIEGGNE